MTTSAEALPIRFDRSGLIPAVIQDADRDDVLMVGFMNDEALTATRSTGRVHFWSRSRNKLWRKGETSGHEQVVETISVNCDKNSLLVRVHQIGAVCHDGYDTCYYRDLQPDNQLAVNRERAFDPASVYGEEGDADLAGMTKGLMETYSLLRDHDLTEESATSRRLRNREDDIQPRISDELRELAGVLAGTHRHRDLHADIQLEASQVIYWVVLDFLRQGLGWSDVRPDRAFLTTDPALSTDTLTTMLLADATGWLETPPESDSVAARSHATLSLVAQACLAGDVAIARVIAADLHELRSRPYLQPFIGAATSTPEGVLSGRISTERAAACP
ncbi:MAG: phosphoribosyl-AMP cyclohydrolase [Thermomicrobiales bacterium]